MTLTEILDELTQLTNNSLTLINNLNIEDKQILENEKKKI